MHETVYYRFVSFVILRIAVRADQHTQREVGRVANETSCGNVSKAFRFGR